MIFKKFRIFIATALVALAIICGCLIAANMTTAYAAEQITEPPAQDIIDEEQTENESSLSQRVIEYLKAIYGADYETYYNKIVENWGSIEAYILNAADNLPEEIKYNTQRLLSNINVYIGVIADAVLFVGAGVYVFVRRSKNKKINNDLEALKAAQNQSATADIAIIQAQKAQNEALKALMPGAKFESSTAQLSACDKALTAAEEEVKRNVVEENKNF